MNIRNPISSHGSSSKLKNRRGTRTKNAGTQIDAIFITKLFMALFFGIFVSGCFNLVRSFTVETDTNAITNVKNIHDVTDEHRLRGGGSSSRNSAGNINKSRGQGQNQRRKFNETAYLDTFPYKFNHILDTENYQAKGGDRFSEWKDGESPYLISDNVMIVSDAVARERREHVRNSMKHAWSGYKKYAFGYDEVKPVSGGKNSRWTGIGVTLVDSLDTLWLMDMKEEFNEAQKWVEEELDFNKDQYTSVFETTIRSLGGLLAAYDWSGESIFLEKAKDLGDRLFKSFNTPNGIPYGEVNLATGSGRNEAWLGNEVSLSAGTTLQVEFRYLAEATGNKEYAQKAERVFEQLKTIEPADGLYPATVVNKDQKPRFGFRENKISFGSRADSFYEYMLKIWLQGNRKEQMYRDMYDKSMQGMHDHLLQKGDSGLWYIAQSVYSKKHSYKILNPSMDHLVCFMGGLLALGAYTDPEGLESERAQRDLKTGKALTYSCYQMYASTATGLSPEIVSNWKSRPSPDHNSPFYILRPEAVESFFILYHLTGDPVYREWGWEVFQSIEKYCKTDIAYGHYPDVEDTNREPEDNMESFFLGETLKYLYLLFDPDTEIDIMGMHVFNTEAHPLRNFAAFKQ